MKKPIKNNPSLLTNRKYLRNNATPAERELWKYLQKSKLENKKFRRQFSIGNYILDFYCPSEKISIELDGEDHFTDSGFRKDKVRDAFLKEQDICVIRIENKWVFKNIEAVLEEIKRNFV